MEKSSYVKLVPGANKVGDRWGTLQCVVFCYDSPRKLTCMSIPVEDTEKSKDNKTSTPPRHEETMELRGNQRGKRQRFLISLRQVKMLTYFCALTHKNKLISFGLEFTTAKGFNLEFIYSQ